MIDRSMDLTKKFVGRCSSAVLFYSQPFVARCLLSIVLCFSVWLAFHLRLGIAFFRLIQGFFHLELDRRGAPGALTMGATAHWRCEFD